MSVPKNIIFLVAYKNPTFAEKYGGFDWMDYAIKSWTHWCRGNNAELVIYDNPSVDIDDIRITWQRWFDVFDFIESKGINYDKIFMNDANSIIRWDSPDFLTEHCTDTINGWRDSDNLAWIYDSVMGYKKFFNDFNFDISKYVNSNIIFNKNHKDFFLKFEKLYRDNTDKLIELQDNIVKKGTDQTPLNYFLQMNNMKINYLPMQFNVTHPHRKQFIMGSETEHFFSYNWQLNEDKTPFFIKYTNHWKFSGMAKNLRLALMKTTWNLIKENYREDDEELLNSVRHKNTYKESTSRKFKTDILYNFSDKKYKEMTTIEFGCCQGDTTKILGEVFKKVIAVDRDKGYLDIAKTKCMDSKNIEFLQMDILQDTWNFENIDVVFWDVHPGNANQGDIEKHLDLVISYFPNSIIVVDDYGFPAGNNKWKNAITTKVREDKLVIDKFIGEYPGVETAGGWTFNDREGVILKLK